MKRYIIILLISSLIGSSSIETVEKPYSDIRKEIGVHKLSTLNQEQIKKIDGILQGLNDIERHHFFISFNHHYDNTNEFRQKTTVKVNLSKLQYHDSSRISKEDIDRVIQIAYRHATYY